MSPTIRLASEADAGQIQTIYAPIVGDTPFSFEMQIPTVDEMRERIHHKLEQYPWLVAEHNGSLLGYAYGGRWRDRAAYEWTVEVSVYVHPSAQRQRVGRAVYTALFDVLYLQGFVTAVAGITLPNAASVGLHEGVGFQSVGVYRNVGYKFDTWHDVGWWQLALRPTPLQPERPRNLHSIVGTKEWDAALASGARLIRV
ncbi:MAG: arsinothricin resistance N-acetyltransferase ArsN1 family B [Anaerolineae bacterium]